jgi:hypothetical protein
MNWYCLSGPYVYHFNKLTITYALHLKVTHNTDGSRLMLSSLFHNSLYKSILYMLDLSLSPPFIIPYITNTLTKNIPVIQCSKQMVVCWWCGSLFPSGACLHQPWCIIWKYLTSKNMHYNISHQMFTQKLGRCSTSLLAHHVFKMFCVKCLL